ncbi:MAG TPA: ABC transporter permease, partial [Anaerolineales bacterium]
RGSLEMFRVAPVSSSSVILGKYMGYTVFLALMAGALVALLMLLGTPFLGDYRVLAGLLLLLIVASLGIGFIISCISNSDSTAVQLSMLVLLISIFFSGFFLPLENFTPLMQNFTQLIPLTHGIQALQRIMLTGALPRPGNWIMLAVISVVSYIIVELLFKRILRRL